MDSRARCAYAPAGAGLEEGEPKPSNDDSHADESEHADTSGTHALSGARPLVVALPLFLPPLASELLRLPFRLASFAFSFGHHACLASVAGFLAHLLRNTEAARMM